MLPVVTKAWADQTMFERMATAVERVTERLQRAVSALNAAGVPYAVVGGNAVAAWVSTIDPAAVRTTQDVDILFRESDLDAAERALSQAGFVRRHAAGIDFFQDGQGTSFRDAVHVVIAGRKVRPEYALPAPDVTETEYRNDARVVSLLGLLRMKLTSFRRKDQVHVLDMLGVGLVDASWKGRLPPDLAERLQLLIDTPEG